LQRSLSPRVLARIFGVQEALMQAGWAIGSALAPLLVLLIGVQGAFVVTAAVLPLVGLVCWPWVRRLDRAAPSGDAIRLLRSVGVFSVLPLPQLEQLATALEPRPALTDGEVLLAEGEHGEQAQHCYVVTRGTLVIDRGGVEVARLGPGDLVGEIALLRDIARTATARAHGPVEVVALERETFLLAVTGSDRAFQAADEGARQRLEAQGA
jgi:hypothetical protein